MMNKQFDCVEMIEEIQTELQDKLDALSPEEQLAFWSIETDKLRNRQLCVQQNCCNTPESSVQSPRHVISDAL